MPRITRTVILIITASLFAAFSFPAPSAASVDVPEIAFNIAENDIVQLDDFLLVAELSDQLLEQYDDFRFLIDGEEVIGKLIREEGLLTFLPGEDFDVGKHLVEVIGIKSGVEDVISELGFGAVLKDLEKFISGELDIEDAILALGGELVLEADINELEGIGKDILKRDPGEALTQIASNIATDKWGVDIMMLLDSDQGRYTQIYDRLKVGITTEDLDVLLGETFPRFSDYTIKGRRLQGLSWADVLGDMQLEGAWGQALRKIPTRLDEFGGILDPGSPGLDVYAMRLATEAGLPVKAGVTLLGGDETTYGPDYEFAGAENRVVSVDFGYGGGSAFSIDGEYAFATNKEETDAASISGEAKRAELKYEAGDNLLKVTYKDVEPTFDSSGLNSIRTDARGYEIEDRFSFAEGITGNINHSEFRDNLDSASPNTRWTDSTSGRLTYRPDGFPGGFDFTMRRFESSNNLSADDPAAYDYTTESMSVSGFIRAELFGGQHQMRLTYSERSSEDAVRLTNTSESSDLSIYWNVRFDSGLGLNLGLGKQVREIGEGSDRDSLRYDILFSYPLDDGRLVLTGGYGYTSLDGDEFNGDSDRLNARVGLRWKLTPFYHIEATYQRLDFDDEGNPERSYDDDSFKLKLVRAF